MRAKGTAKVAVTMNELQATDALFGELVTLLGMMALQARMLGFLVFSSSAGMNIWCHLLRVLEITFLPLVFVCVCFFFPFCFLLGYLKCII